MARKVIKLYFYNTSLNTPDAGVKNLSIVDTEKAKQTIKQATIQERGGH